MKPIIRLAMAAGGLCLASCGAFEPQARIKVLIPTPPDHWIRAFPDLEFVLVFPGVSGEEQEIKVADATRPTTITCSKAGNSSILAYPRSSRDGKSADARAGPLRPAGGLYPGSIDDTGAEPTLLLDWRDGAVATVLSRLHALGRDTSLVNASRLSQYFREAADPWNLDLEGIAEKLAKGDFSAYDIDLLPCRDINVKAGAGEWFMESPFSPVTALVQEGTLTLRTICLGMHTLFSIDGRLVKIDVGRKETFVKSVGAADALLFGGGLPPDGKENPLCRINDEEVEE
jgi:hypothetical protein